MAKRVGEQFRERIAAEPSGKTTIRGASFCLAEELAEFAERRRQPVGLNAARLYVRLGERYGVRGDVAFCQALYETRALAEGRLRPIGEARAADLWGLQGRDGLDEERFIETHLQLLYGFAAAEPAYADLDASVWTPRLRALERMKWRGSAPHWEDLNGKWSSPGAHYGQDIMAIWRHLVRWAEAKRARAARRPVAPLAAPSVELVQAGGAAAALGLGAGDEGRAAPEAVGAASGQPL